MAFPTVGVTPGVGVTINTLPNAGQSTMGNSLSVTVASDQTPVPQNIVDGIVTSQKATVAQFHNADNQAPGNTAYGLLTGGVAQLLNAVGNLDRQREAGQNNVTSLGVPTGTSLLRSPVSTTLNGSVSAASTSATLTATKFTNAGQPAWVQIGTVLVLDFGTITQEAVVVTAINYSTNFVSIFGLGTGNGFRFSHSNGGAVAFGAYNEAVDATTPEGSDGVGIGLSGTTLFNSTLNSGAGGWENERSANGELDGASGKGTTVAAEYEFNSGGPVLASGLVTGFQFDRARNVQGKALGSGSITSTGSGNNSIVFSSAAATNLLQPGQKIRLRGGSVKETVVASQTWTPGSSATVPIQSPVVNASQTTAEWDVYGTSGPALNGFLADGVGIEEEALYDPVSDLFYIERSSTQDGIVPQNVVAENPVLWNGSSMDRQRGNVDTGAIVTLSAASSGGNSSDQTNYNGRGLQLGINITAITGTSPTLTVTIQGKDTGSAQYYTLLVSAVLNATGFTLLTVYPGAPTTANVSSPQVLPRTWRILYAIGGGTPAVTATIGASVIV